MVGCRRRRTELLELRVVRESQFCRRTATCPHPSRTDRARGLRHDRSPDPRSNHSHPFVSDDDIPCSGSALHRCTSATAPWWWKSIFSPAALNSTCSENRAQLEMDTDSAPTSSVNSRRRASSQFSANSGCPPGGRADQCRGRVSFSRTTAGRPAQCAHIPRSGKWEAGLRRSPYPTR